VLDLSAYKILVNVGTGGIGKTTVSAAMGYLAAENKVKTLVLTIDPSQRLKTVMGLEPGKNYKAISNYLDVSIIDHREIFDLFIKESVSDNKLVQKLFNNSLYQQLSQSLATSQEFTSLEALYKNYKNRNYDLIVLDTAPNEHVIDFLNAPQKLASLFNPKVFEWFSEDQSKKNFIKKAINRGTVQVLDSLTKVTGSEFMTELFTFFSALSQWQKAIYDRTIRYHDLLTSEQVGFLQVLTLNSEKIRQTMAFSKEVKKMGYNLVGTIVNRADPPWSHEKLEQQQWSKEVQNLYTSYSSYYKNSKKQLDQYDIKNCIYLPEQLDFISEFDGIKKLSYYLGEQVQL